MEITAQNLKLRQGMDPMWRGGYADSTHYAEGKLYGYALVLRDNTTTWNELRIQNTPDSGWVIVMFDETIEIDVDVDAAPWHVTKNGKPSKSGAQHALLDLIAA